VDDEVLAKFEKRHTRADFLVAAALCRTAGLTLVPTFVAFTPWTTLDGYRDLLEVIGALDLTEHVAPVQWGIRLLVTWQSRLLELPEVRALVGPFDRTTLTFPWRHPDPRVDKLQVEVMKIAGARINGSRSAVFGKIRAHLGTAAPQHLSTSAAPHPRTSIPYLDEPWYC
jgi:hypothetical protein